MNTLAATRRDPQTWLLAAFILLGAFVRFFDLAADPSPFKRYGDVSDEGGMAHNARLYALGVPCVDDFFAGDSNAALMSVLLRIVFRLFGVSLATTHLASAIAGTLLVAVLAAFATTQWGRTTGLVTAALGAVVEAGVIYSRLAIPEMVQTLFLTIAFLAIVRNKRGAPLVSGAFMALAFLTKVTAIYYGPPLLAVFWYTNKEAELNRPQRFFSRLSWFTAAGLVVCLPWIVFWYFPDWQTHWRTIRATADNDSNGKILSFAIFQISRNYFLGFPSVAMLVIIAVVAAIDRQLRANDRALNALLIWIGAFLVIIAFMSDKSDRRFVPMIAPLIVVGGRVLGSGQAWSSGLPGVSVALGVLGILVFNAHTGSLTNAFSNGLARTIATIGVCVAGVALLFFLRNRGTNRIGRLALGVTVVGFCLPSASALVLRTHTIRDSSRKLDEQFGRSFVAGPLAHSLALEARFYPVFFTPGGEGIKRLNSEFDRNKFDYQLVIPRIAYMYGPVGFGRREVPRRIGEINLLPNFVHHAWWTIDVYDLRSTTVTHEAHE